MNMDVIGKGDFLPIEFWVATSSLLGIALVSMLTFIINRFLNRLDISIDSLKENVQELRESNKLCIERLNQHDEDIKELRPKRR